MVKFIDKGKYVPRAKAILEHVGNLRLVGETGTAKTTLVYYLVEQGGWNFYEYSLNTDTTRWDLIASDTLNKGSTEIREGIIVKWLRDTTPGKVKVLYLDEFNYAQPGVTTLLNQLADFRRSIWIPELEQTFQRTDLHYIIIAMNPAEKSVYTGTTMANIAQTRRFESLRLDFLPPQDETKYLMACMKDGENEYEWVRKLVEFANKTRAAYRLGKLSTPVTTGNLLNYCRLYEHELDDRDILEIVQALYTEEESNQIKRYWEGEGVS